MANVLKAEESLSSAFKKGLVIGLGITGAGVIGILLGIFFVAKSPYQELRPFVAFVGVIVVIVGLGVVKRASKFHNGALGESRVAEVLAGFPDDWYIFNDMIVGRSQIDHIVICPKGVYTIETKNYQGTIHGNAEKREWSQFIDDHETKFYNPVKQGDGHSLALKKYLHESGVKKVWVNTIVVFTEPEVVLKVYSSKVPVIYVSGLKEFFDNRPKVLSPHECAEMAETVNKLISDRRRVAPSAASGTGRSQV